MAQQIALSGILLSAVGAAVGVLTVADPDHIVDLKSGIAHVAFWGGFGLLALSALVAIWS